MVHLSTVLAFRSCCLAQMRIPMIKFVLVLVCIEWHICLGAFWCWPYHRTYHHFPLSRKFQPSPALLAHTVTQGNHVVVGFAGMQFLNAAAWPLARMFRPSGASQPHRTGSPSLPVTTTPTLPQFWITQSSQKGRRPLSPPLRISHSRLSSCHCTSTQDWRLLNCRSNSSLLSLRLQIVKACLRLGNSLSRGSADISVGESGLHPQHFPLKDCLALEVTFHCSEL